MPRLRWALSPPIRAPGEHRQRQFWPCPIRGPPPTRMPPGRNLSSILEAATRPIYACRQFWRSLDSHGNRSEEHTSELQSLMRISYAVFCLKKKKKDKTTNNISKQAQRKS